MNFKQTFFSLTALLIIAISSDSRAQSAEKPNYLVSPAIDHIAMMPSTDFGHKDGGIKIYLKPGIPFEQVKISYELNAPQGVIKTETTVSGNPLIIPDLGYNTYRITHIQTGAKDLLDKPGIVEVLNDQSQTVLRGPSAKRYLSGDYSEIPVMEGPHAASMNAKIAAAASEGNQYSQTQSIGTISSIPVAGNSGSSAHPQAQQIGGNTPLYTSCTFSTGSGNVNLLTGYWFRYTVYNSVQPNTGGSGKFLYVDANCGTKTIDGICSYSTLYWGWTLNNSDRWQDNVLSNVSGYSSLALQRKMAYLYYSSPVTDLNTERVMHEITENYGIGTNPNALTSAQVNLYNLVNNNYKLLTKDASLVASVNPVSIMQGTASAIITITSNADYIKLPNGSFTVASNSPTTGNIITNNGSYYLEVGGTSAASRTTYLKYNTSGLSVGSYPLNFCTLNITNNDCRLLTSYVYSPGSPTQPFYYNNNPPTDLCAPVTITVTAACALDINLSPVPICAGSTITLTPTLTTNTNNGTLSYLWTPGNSTGSTLPNVSPATTTDYTVTVTGSTGCVDQVTARVTVNAKPTVTATGGNSLCSGSAGITLTASGAASYSWTPSATLSSSIGNTVIATPTTTTTYTVTGTDANSCSASDTQKVTVNVKPTVTATGGNSLCSGSAGITLTASGAASYSWTPSATLSSSTGSTVTATPAATTTYTVTGTDANGCSASDTQKVTVNVKPTVVIAGSNSSCSAIGTLLTASGATSYSWTPSATLSSSIGSTVTATPTATTTYTVTGTDANGCSASDTQKVTVNSISASATASLISCLTSDTSTVSVIASLGSGAYTYSWTGPNGFTRTTQSFKTTTTGNYTVTVTDATTGCTAQSVATVSSTVNKPVVTLTGNNPVCTNSAVTITAAVTAGTGVAPFTYEFANNAGTILQSGSTSTLTLTPAGISSIVVKATGANNCAAIQSIPVNSPGPATNITNLAIICRGSSTTIQADNGVALAGYSYLWTDINLAGVLRGTVSPNVHTSYPVVRTSPQGCKDTAIARVRVYGKPVIVNVAATQPACASNTGTIMVTATGDTTLRYRLNSGTWQSANTFTNLAAGSYTVTVGNTNGICSDTTTPPLTLTAASTIVSGINGPAARCAAEDMQFQAQPPVTGATYQWSATGTPVITPTGSNGPAGTTGSTLIANWAATLAGTTQTVTLTVSKGGCTATYQQEVTITGAIRSNAGPDKGMCPASQVTIGTTPNFSDTGTTPFATYNWTPSTYILNGATSAQAVVNPPVTTVYTLTVTDPVNGCTKTDQVTVNVSVAYNPVADAGTDAVLDITNAPNTVQLGGPGTTLPGAEPNTSIEYLWTAISPAPITALSSVGSATPVFTRPAGVTAGTVYKYVLMVQKQYLAPSINKGVTCPVFDTVQISFDNLGTSVCVSPKAYLQGPLTQDGQAGNSGNPLMRTDLAQYGLLPLKDPYSAGTEQVTIDFSGTSIPAKTTTAAVLARSGVTAIVDWVLVQLRDATSGAIMGTVPALMQSDGNIVDASGSGSVCFSGIPTTSTVRLAVLHRNHLAIASTQTFKVAAMTAALSYDFTTGLSKAYNNGANTQMVLKNGSYAMWGANDSGDGFVDAQDKGPIYDDASGGNLFLLYKESDVNMDGFFDGLDQSLWFENNVLSPYSGLLGL